MIGGVPVDTYLFQSKHPHGGRLLSTNIAHLSSVISIQAPTREGEGIVVY